MTDVAQRPTGEQAPMRNGAAMWKWLTGIIVTVLLSSGGIFLRVHTGLARVEVEIQAIKDQMVLERGLTSRLDTDVRANRERIIKLEP